MRWSGGCATSMTHKWPTTTMRRLTQWNPIKSRCGQFDSTAGSGGASTTRCMCLRSALQHVNSDELPLSRVGGDYWVKPTWHNTLHFRRRLQSNFRPSPEAKLTRLGTNNLVWCIAPTIPSSALTIHTKIGGYNIMTYRVSFLISLICSISWVLVNALIGTTSSVL